MESPFLVSHFEDGATSEAPPPTATARAISTRPVALNFRQAQAAYSEVTDSSLGGADEALQKRIGEGLALCEATLVQVEAHAIFSTNEVADDINTGDLKYLLLPFYRGELLLKVCDQTKRPDALKEALTTLRGFLKDLERLELLSAECSDWESFSTGASTDPASVRNQKIARFKANKLAKQKLEELSGKAAAKAKRRTHRRTANLDDDDDDDDDDDEIEREQMLLLLQTCCHTAIDSLREAVQEQEMLAQIAKMRREDGTLPPPVPDDPANGLQMLSLLPSAPGRANLPSTLSGFRPTDPSRDPSSRLSYATAMRQIHTGEIPGLYTYTVEEGLRQEEAERALGEAARMDAMGERAAAREQAKVDREYGNDEEDEEERQKLIKQDDWREMHKRGAGNRKNRS